MNVNKCFNGTFARKYDCIDILSQLKTWIFLTQNLHLITTFSMFAASLNTVGLSGVFHYSINWLRNERIQKRFLWHIKFRGISESKPSYKVKKSNLLHAVSRIYSRVGRRTLVLRLTLILLSFVELNALPWCQSEEMKILMNYSFS